MTPSVPRTARLAAAMLATLGLVAACSSDSGSDSGSGSGDEPEAACTPTEITYGELDPEVGAQDIDEEALVVYSGRSEDLIGPALELFTTETGIDVAVRYGGTAAMTAQIMEEGDASPADVVISQDAGALGALAGVGCLATLPPETLEQVDEDYRPESATWAALTGRARVIAYNPDLVAESELPTTLEELTDPAVASQLGIAPTNASFQAFVTAIRVTDGDEAAATFLADLAAGGVQTFDGNGDVLAAVDDGTLAMGLINHYYLYELEAESGETTARNHYPADGGPLSLVNISGAGVVSATDRQQDAIALVEFLLSESAQEYFATETNEYPMVPGSPEPADAPALDELDAPQIDLDDLDDLPATIQLINDSGLV